MFAQLKRLWQRDGSFLFMLSAISAIIIGIQVFSVILLQNTHIPAFIRTAMSVSLQCCYLGLFALMVSRVVEIPLKKKWKFAVVLLVLSLVVSVGLVFLVRGIATGVSVETLGVLNLLSQVLNQTFYFVLLSILWVSCWKSRYAHSANGWGKLLISCLCGAGLSAAIILLSPVLDNIMVHLSNYLINSYEIIALWDMHRVGQSELVELLIGWRFVFTQVALFIGMTGIIYILSAWTLAQQHAKVPEMAKDELKEEVKAAPINQTVQEEKTSQKPSHKVGEECGANNDNTNDEDRGDDEDWDDDDDEKPFQMPDFKTRIIILLCVLAVVCLGSLVAYMVDKEHQAEARRRAQETQRQEQESKRLDAAIDRVFIVRALNKYRVNFEGRRSLDSAMRFTKNHICEYVQQTGASYEQRQRACYYEISDWEILPAEKATRPIYVAYRVQTTLAFNGDKLTKIYRYLLDLENHLIAPTNYDSCVVLNSMKGEMLIREQADAERYIRECSRNDFYVE